MAKVRKLVRESSNDKSVGNSHSEVQKSSFLEHGHWCHASDAYNREATVDEVHASRVYLLFYKRIWNQTIINMHMQSYILTSQLVLCSILTC